MHTITLEHELAKAVKDLAPLFNSDTYSYGGSTSTVGRANYNYASDIKIKHGATVRVVAEMGETINALSAIPGGQNGHPMSEHYDSQLIDWVNGDLTNIQSVGNWQQAQLRLLPKSD